MLRVSDMGFVRCYISDCKPVRYHYWKGQALQFGSASFSILDMILDAWLSRIDTFQTCISGLARF